MTNEATLRVIIVDDEQPARQVLAEFLGDHPVDIVAECENGFEAVKKVTELTPDLVFLDIQMPKLDGFEVLELLGEAAPAVVFVTAYDEYALRAFEVHAVDYLLKPFTEERLAAALARARSNMGQSAESPAESPSAAELARDARPENEGPLDRILVRDGSRIHVVPCHRLDYIEAQDDYVILVAGDDKLKKPQRISQLEKQLDPQRFVRIHRSYILNIERLDRLELYAKDSRLGILRDGTRLPVSRAGYGRLRKLL